MGWFDLTEVHAQADGIAEEYARLRASGAALAVKGARQVRRTDKTVARAVAYMGTLGLNLYKKSRFLQRLRAQLIGRQVPADEAEAFAREVMLGPLGTLRGAK